MGYRYFKNNLSVTNYGYNGCGASSLKCKIKQFFCLKKKFIHFFEKFAAERVSTMAKLSNPCLICKKTFESAAGLKKHFKNHQDEKAPRNQICGGCGLGFLFPSALKLQVDGVNGGPIVLKMCPTKIWPIFTKYVNFFKHDQI